MEISLILKAIFDYWNHVWAVPCNGKEECFNGLDEIYCQFQLWILPSILLGFLFILSFTLVFYLYTYLNEFVESTLSKYSQGSINNDCQSKQMLKFAKLVQDKDIEKLKELYHNERDNLGSDAALFCYLKVLNLKKRSKFYYML